MSRPRAALVGLALALVALAGCDPLETGYASLGEESVNGIDALTAHWAKAFDPGRTRRLGDKLDEHDLLLHVARERGLPSGEGLAWIRGWLEASDGRQAVLILRDGGVAAWLCRRWAAEAKAEASRPGADAAKYREMERRLEERATKEEEPPALDPDAEVGDELLRLRGIAPIESGALAGLLGGEAPQAMRVRSEIVPGERARPLISVGGKTWAAAIAIGESRLIVCANATPLLDGALVDPRARDLLAALTAEIASRSPAKAAWVSVLGVSSGPPPDAPSPLAMLLGTPPFSYVAWHLVALAFIFVGWRAFSLRRIADVRDRELMRFARHVDALAWHLRAAGAAAAAAQEIAKALGRPLADAPAAPEAARAAVADLYRDGAPPSPLPQESR